MSEESPTPKPSEVCSVEAIKQASSPRRRFGDVERLVETTSTNELLVARALDGAPDGSVIVADRQSEGRGRRSRKWVSPPEGALLCSVLFRPALLLEEIHLLSSIVALGALAAARATTGAGVMLKWPNDLVAGNKKVAGVLAELVSTAPPAVVVGIGCNLYWPAGWPPPSAGGAHRLGLKDAATLEDVTGRVVTRDEFLEAFLDELELLYDRLLAPGGPARIAVAQRAACATIGRRVRVETETGALVGIASGIRADGALEVEIDGVTRAFSVADVVHLRGGE